MSDSKDCYPSPPAGAGSSTSSTRTPLCTRFSTASYARHTQPDTFRPSSAFLERAAPPTAPRLLPPDYSDHHVHVRYEGRGRCQHHDEDHKPRQAGSRRRDRSICCMQLASPSTSMHAPQTWFHLCVGWRASVPTQSLGLRPALPLPAAWTQVRMIPLSLTLPFNLFSAL